MLQSTEAAQGSPTPTPTPNLASDHQKGTFLHRGWPFQFHLSALGTLLGAILPSQAGAEHWTWHRRVKASLVPVTLGKRPWASVFSTAKWDNKSTDSQSSGACCLSYSLHKHVMCDWSPALCQAPGEGAEDEHQALAPREFKAHQRPTGSRSPGVGFERQDLYQILRWTQAKHCWCRWCR